ncbi:DUF342 domain-containing protein [Dissulfurimicrobium hydrothermale]|uniref:DUF342 domain-containing protein n=1 Tax=Dissulfurimicrobium hydrothermale TaxID=1750598 RepID=UPI001EDC15FE|nr:FapA family protein [Dissulfurimicrobium hydrothermale]UKL12974.1 FapA family protein [Dissulfurimicrobium hydrothermale]
MKKEELDKGVILYGTAVLKVSKNGMEAALSPIEQDIDPDCLHDLPEILKQYEIIYGIQRPPQFENGRWVVARGNPPVDGEDGGLEFMPRFEGLKEPESNSHKRFVNVSKDDIIAKIIPPTPGIPGKDIFGHEIPPKPGKPAQFKLGQGAAVSSDEIAIIASRSGKAEIKNGEITVLDEYIINGDLDITIGDMEFWGRLLTISGSISGAFKVSTWNDLTVTGNIEGEAQIYVKGNLKVGGIIRGNKTRVNTGNDLYAKAIEYADISVGGDMEVEDYILKAECRVKGYAWIIQGRGMISGGNLFLGHSLAVNTLGSPTNIFTNISIGFDFDLMSKYKKIVDDLETIAKKLEDVKNGLKKIDLLERSGPLDEKFSFIKQHLSNTLIKLGEEAILKKGELEKLQEELTAKQSATIFVNKNIYSNTRITIYNATFDCPIDLNGKYRLIYQNGEVLTIPFT